jgi:DNA-directed RNA polymerase subunit beta'
VGKKQLGVIVNDLAERYSKVQVANSLDALKEAGFTWATRSGVDRVHRGRRHAGEQGADPARVRGPGREGPEAVRQGLITDDERRQELIEIWTQASNEVAKAMEANFDRSQPDLHDGRLGCAPET